MLSSADRVKGFKVIKNAAVYWLGIDDFAKIMFIFHLNS
jgi:hypothetical protein